MVEAGVDSPPMVGRTQKGEGAEMGEGQDGTWQVERRRFLKASAFAIAGMSAPSQASRAGEEPRLRLGIVTDAHYANAPPKGERHYRESLAKMRECVEAMNRTKVQLLVELGDLKDQDSPPEEAATLGYLAAIEEVLKAFDGPRYHVLGNHDLDSISKEQFASIAPSTGISPDETYYSLDINGVHLVMLDAAFRRDGEPYDHGRFDWREAWIPDRQREWLERDLELNAHPVLVFVHQRLDGESEYCVGNAAEIRKILERSGRVLAVFQGHDHAGGYRRLHGIHYCTQRAMVVGAGPESSAYSTVEVFSDNAIRVTGYRRARNRMLGRHIGPE